MPAQILELCLPTTMSPSKQVGWHLRLHSPPQKSPQITRNFNDRWKKRVPLLMIMYPWTKLLPNEQECNHSLLVGDRRVAEIPLEWIHPRTSHRPSQNPSVLGPPMSPLASTNLNLLIPNRTGLKLMATRRLKTDHLITKRMTHMPLMVKNTITKRMMAKRTMAKHTRTNHMMTKYLMIRRTMGLTTTSLLMNHYNTRTMDIRWRVPSMTSPCTLLQNRHTHQRKNTNLIIREKMNTTILLMPKRRVRVHHGMSTMMVNPHLT
mmetsp:Transcript_291/g.413  ORF Transcript_291/g.413 Transcript_291/m.413 type:complete len:263 (-) Transcript_291:1373-2161(-)